MPESSQGNQRTHENWMLMQVPFLKRMHFYQGSTGEIVVMLETLALSIPSSIATFTSRNTNQERNFHLRHPKN